MASLSLQFGPYSFLGALLSILGLVSTIFLARFEYKTTAMWFATLALAGFTASMVTIFLVSTLVLWGSAFWPMQDAWAVFSMAAATGLIYHYPAKDSSMEARLAQWLGVGAVVLAFGYSFYFAWGILFNHKFDPVLNPFYLYLMPIAVLATLGLAVRRTVIVHRAAIDSHSSQRSILSAFVYPRARARPLRNLCVALMLGTLQGLASGLGVFGLLPMPLDMYATGLSLMAMIIVLVYSTWGYATRQPSLIVKLIGLALVTLLAALGTVGMFDIHNDVLQSEAARLMELEIARQSVQAGDLSALPPTIEYIVAQPDLETAQGPVRLIYARDADKRAGALLLEIMAATEKVAQPSAAWGYYYDYYLTVGEPRAPANLYFGSHPTGSYHQYVGYTFRSEPSNGNAPSQTYEALFDLAAANAPVHRAGLTMTVVILVSSLFILVVFPMFFRASITNPLGRLLRGVTQANAGDLSVSVPISQDDEIGFLTQSFNAMIASIQTQIEARQQKEAALQELTATLEQRIAGRTRELAVLYDISAAASQAQTIETLLTRSLAQAMAALDSDLGAAFLIEPSDSPNGDSPPDSDVYLKRIACQGSSDDMEIMPTLLPAVHELFAPLFQERESSLVFDITVDARVPEQMRQLGQRSLLAAPLRAEDRVLGALVLIHKTGKTYSAEEVALLSSIADQVGISIQSSRLRQQAVVLEERQHLARDLHDSVTQVLYGLVTLAEAGQARLETGRLGAAQPTFERIAATARQALNEMRLFVHRLRPPELEQHGLAAALNQRVAAVEGWSGVRVRLLADEAIRLPPDVEAGLYQIAQEALNNALRHSHASVITLKLQPEDRPNVTRQHTLLEISDDGCGFDPERAHAHGLGLTHMAERARILRANFEIITRPGEGTRVKVVV
ncbi:MAG: HAMP domain-containing protein [Chloroflexi bacterium]|nr:HAMP domain-containing protein [Chloroflexota bacterium]